MKIRLFHGLLLLLVLGVISCKEDDNDIQLEANAGPDQMASIGDTVWLDAGNSIGQNYEIAWSIKNQPESDSINHSDSVVSWFIPLSNGLYQCQLSLSSGALYSKDYADVTVSGAVKIQDTIRVPTTLTKISLDDQPDYIATGDVVVLSELTVSPSVVIEFKKTAGLLVKDGGRIKMINARLIPSDSSWNGIYLETSDNVISNTIIDRAGNTTFTGNPEDKASIFTSGKTTLAFSGNTISNSGGYGIIVLSETDFYYDTPNGVYPFTNNRFVNNAHGPMRIPVHVLSELAGQNMENETPGSFIEIYPSTYQSAEQKDPWFSDMGLSYKITGLLTFNKNLSISGGVRMLFSEPGGIRVNGMLTVSGTETVPVEMKPLDEAAGSWLGVYVKGGHAGISYTSIINAGNNLFSGINEKASLLVDQSLNMAHSVVSGSGGIGIYLLNHAHIQYSQNFQGNRIEDNAGPAIRIRSDDVSKVVSNNTISVPSSSVPAIEVYMGLDDPMGTWTNLDAEIDYKLLETIEVKATKDLIINAGASIQMMRGVRLKISGGLDARGTAGDEVSFLGSSGTAGFWNGIFLSGTQKIIFDHVIIKHAGGDVHDKANLIVEATATDVSVSNSGISESAGYGVLIKAGASDFSINTPESGNTLEGALGGFHDGN